MKESKNALKNRMGRRVDRTISKNKSSFETWVNHHFDGIAKHIDSRMGAVDDGRSKDPGRVKGESSNNSSKK